MGASSPVGHASSGKTALSRARARTRITHAQIPFEVLDFWTSLRVSPSPCLYFLFFLRGRALSWWFLLFGFFLSCFFFFFFAQTRIACLPVYITTHATIWHAFSQPDGRTLPRNRPCSSSLPAPLRRGLFTSFRRAFCGPLHKHSTLILCKSLEPASSCGVCLIPDNS